jgi:metallophosphoesterase (TIGR03767 family)
MGRYLRLSKGPGEARVTRLDLSPGGTPSGQRSSILHLVHLTDMHVVDVQSPGRFEFMERFGGAPTSMKVVLPAHRPHEFLHLQYCEAMIRTLNRLPASPITGAPVSLVVSTGDNIDNAQGNEFDWFLTLMGGGRVSPSSGGPRYEGVQALEWYDPVYWHPDPMDDRPRRDHAFPTYSGLLEEAMSPFEAEGLRYPWVTCYGNHDALLLGAAHVGPSMAAILSGDRKAVLPPAHFQPADLNEFVDHPERLLGAPYRHVTADAGRGAYGRAEYREAMATAPGRPQFHGTGKSADMLYAVDDSIPGVRLIMLDTTNPGGDYQGSLGLWQAGWLEARLTEVHSRSRNLSEWQDGGGEDRLVVICSHMPSGSLVNDRRAEPGTPGRDQPRLLDQEVVALLHRFPNVVLWLNGHTHHAHVVAHPHPQGETPGFWEVTTPSLIDWPGEARIVEIVENDDGTISIFCTMVTADVPLDPAEATGLERLASIARDVMANDPHAGAASPLAGGSADRTVELVVRHPWKGRV